MSNAEDMDFYNEEDLGTGVDEEDRVTPEEVSKSTEVVDEEPEVYGFSLGDEADLDFGDDDEESGSDDLFSAEDRLRMFADKVLSACYFKC